MILESWYEIDEAKNEVHLFAQHDFHPVKSLENSYNYHKENLSHVIQERIKKGPRSCFPEVTECLRIARDELLERGLIEE